MKLKKMTNLNRFQGMTKMNRFQGISCLISKELLLMENNNFSSQMLYRSVSNEQISRNFSCLISKELLLVENTNFSN